MALEKSMSMQSGLEILQTKEKKLQIPEKTFKEKITIILKNITVEPAVLCYELPNIMASLSVQNLNLEKACRVNLQFDQNICDSLTNRNSSGYTPADEIAVQKLVASMNAWKNILQSLIPPILLMFLGSWSDRHQRRKPCILLPMLGELLACTGFIACTYFFYQLPMEWNAIAESIPSGMSGSWFTICMGIYCYVSNVSNLETRTLRIGAVNIVEKVSFTVGIALSGILCRKIGFYGVFSLSMTLYTIGILYVSFWVKEVPQADTVKVNDSFLKDFFNIKHILGTIKVAFKEGEQNRKKRVLLIMVLVMVIIGPIHGEINVLYLFVRYKFKWNEIDYSIFATFIVVMHMIGTAFSLLFFSKILKVDDAILGVISNLSKILASFIFAFASESWIFYLGGVVEMLNGTSFIAMRSIISKLVPPDELGKINSLFAVCEALMPLLYGPMYSLTYKKTINWLPGFFFILGGILTIPSVLIFLWLYTEHKKDEKLSKQTNNQEKAPLNETARS